MTIAKPPRRGVPQPLQGGPQRFGPYSLVARLAVGGTSEVYLAELVDRAAQPSRPEAVHDRIIVKRLLPHLVADAEGRTTFEREAVLHAAVSHPNVVSVFRSGMTEQGEPYLAMEYVNGCDAFRLLRRATQRKSVLPFELSVYVAREVLLGLAAVHAAKDESGTSFAMIHRDVTPSNIYLSRTGDVKLGDFGIARAAHRAPVLGSPNAPPAVPDMSVMGKFSYLAPEQVAGEPFDHRADLFSMATVLTEMVIGRPLFPGTSQLQVLLAIRDCRLGPLHEAAERLPKGLAAVLEKALARDPKERFQDAATFEAALVPFLGAPAIAKSALAARVLGVQTLTSESEMAAVRETNRAMQAVKLDASLTPIAPLEGLDALSALDNLEIDIDMQEPEAPGSAPYRADADDPDQDQDTGAYPLLESFVLHANGERLGPWRFAQLIEGIANGTVGHGDRVDYMGMGPRAIEEIPDLAKLLSKDGPPSTGVRDAALAASSTNLAETALLDVLAEVLVTKRSGRLVLERASRGAEGSQQREVFFLHGRLHHIASRDASDFLGEFLVRRGRLAREELDLALAVLPRYGGKMGDTLIALGLVDGVDIFRAIREQGRDRMIDLFLWREGSAVLHPEDDVAAVDFPLDLDLPTLMLAGMEASHPGDAPMAFIEPRLDSIVVPNARPELADFTWPPLVTSVLEELTAPIPLREVLARVTMLGLASGADVARALELLLAVDLARWQ